MYVECEPVTDRRIFFEVFCFQLINDRQGNTKAKMVTIVIGSNNPVSKNTIEQLAKLAWKMLSMSIWCLLSSEVDSRIHEVRCAFFAHDGRWKNVFDMRKTCAAHFMDTAINLT